MAEGWVRATFAGVGEENAIGLDQLSKLCPFQSQTSPFPFPNPLNEGDK